MTEKLLVRLDDGRAVETVLIPRDGRTTVCVSTQVGCARGCTFCKTATMGLVRNLTADEIVMQVRLAMERTGDVRNVVYMGMGEPLDNAEATRESLDVLTKAMRLAPKHITVSTVGPSPNAIRGTQGWPARIAWSLHSADDTTRRRLVPTARHDVAALRDAFAELGRTLFVEIALIAGDNDSVEEAERVAKLFADFPAEVRFNLLPMNDIGTADRPASDAATDAFMQHLRTRGFFCMRRRPKGADKSAACGQLATFS